MKQIFTPPETVLPIFAAKTNPNAYTNQKVNAMRAVKRQILSYRTGVAIAAFASVCMNGYAQEGKTAENESSKEEGNRNVMLNAASANGPREIQIGLPSADVNVLENGIPVT